MNSSQKVKFTPSSICEMVQSPVKVALFWDVWGFQNSIWGSFEQPFN